MIDQKTEPTQHLTRHQLAAERFTLAAVCIIWISTLLSLLSRYHWMLDLLSSFHVQYAIGLLLTAPLLYHWRKWGSAAISTIVLGYNLFLITPVYLPGEQPPSGAEPIRLVSANVLTSNHEQEKFLELIADIDPDIILIMEVNESWMRHLNKLKARYPHSVSSTRSDNFGIALFSKLPIQAEIVRIGIREIPSVIAKLEFNGQPVTLIGTHPLPPGGARLAHWRNQQLVAIQKVAISIEGPKVVLGDLNITPWSPYFTDLIDSASLKDSRQGFGIQPTWPSTNPLLRIPIDHVLVSDEIHIHNRMVGSNNGSDHYPVIVDLSIAETQ